MKRKIKNKGLRNRRQNVGEKKREYLGRRRKTQTRRQLSNMLRDQRSPVQRGYIHYNINLIHYLMSAHHVIRKSSSFKF